MSLSPVKFEETLRALLEQQAFLLLVQLSRMWLKESTLSNKACILYAKALLELGCIEEVEQLLLHKESIDSMAVLVESALKQEKWDLALERIAQLQKLSSNHPRLSEFLSRARVAKNQDAQRLIRSHLLEQRLKGIEVMLCLGLRQQARVCLEHWKKDIPHHTRIQDLYAVSRGDLDYDQGWDELLQCVFDRIHDDDQTHKVHLGRSRELYISEDTEDETVLITDPFAENTEPTQKLYLDDGTDSILLIQGGVVSEDTNSLDEVTLNDENIVLFHHDELDEPQVLLQKGKARKVRVQKRRASKRPWMMWVLLLVVLGGSMFTVSSWLLDRGRVSIQQSLVAAALSADMQVIEGRRQILLHKSQSTSFLKEEREDALGIVCAVLWYDFSRDQKELECAEKYVRTPYGNRIYSVLAGLVEGDLEDIEQDILDLEPGDILSSWVLREVEKYYGTLEPTTRQEPRFIIQDLKNGTLRKGIQEGVLPWYDLEFLEYRWGSLSVSEKEDALIQMQKPNVLAVLGPQKHSRVLLLRSILEMEMGNKRRAKLYRLEALKRDPENSRLRYWLGWDYYEEGAMFKASESWNSCVHTDVECAMAKVMVLIDMDQLQEVDSLLEESYVLQPRQNLIHKWLEWSQQDIPKGSHPVFADLLYEDERWRTIFSDVELELKAWEQNERSFRDLSWRGLFFVSLQVEEKDAEKARKVMSMAIQEEGEASSFVRILGWMNKRDNIPHEELWKLYLLQKPSGFTAKKVQEELP